MGFTAWYLSLLYLIAILSDILNGMEKSPGNEYEQLIKFSVLDSEIVNLVNQFRQQDINKVDDGQIILDYQKCTSIHDPNDRDKGRLFKWVDPTLLEKDTYKKWIALNNEYETQVDIPEKSNPKKKKAIDDFLDAILSTMIWKSFYQFLLKKGHPYAESLQTFRARIKQLWFVEYSRKQGLIDSSGFEHVFMGEYKNGEVSGMHSWLRFYLLERNESQEFDYRGFTIKRFNIMAAVKFSWHNHIKRSSTFFIGTSPEFDMALYTICFLTRQSRDICKFQLEECPFSVTSYKLMQQGKIFVGTVYPVAGSFTEKCRKHNSL
uniref:Poly(U)-specific endoribonuclease n=1 Tax=Onchocerca volvulus TaxID=6282 RepID=A0A8R1XUS2_ONCVO